MPVDHRILYTDMVIQGLRERRKVRAMFAGKSMAPTLREGMQILLEETPPEKIELADIIMYKKTDQAVVHRVVGIIEEDRKKIFITKGDNHAYLDADRIPEHDLIGRVSAAFFENKPDTDVLIKNKAVGTCYILLADLAAYIRHLRKFVPAPLRHAFKYFVGAFFFVSKKAIHTLYVGMRCGKLFF